MRARIVRLGVFLLLARPLPVAAFEFDVWRSGMSLSEVLDTARAHDLPIAPSPFAHVSKHYNHQLASKDAGKHGSYKYQSRLLGWPVTVTLQLTPHSRELHTVDVAWNTPLASEADRELLEANLVDILSRKYGESSRPVPGSLGDYIFQRRPRQWVPDQGNRILTETRLGNALHLHYVDLGLKDKAEREARVLREQKAGQGRAADAGRF